MAETVIEFSKADIFQQNNLVLHQVDLRIEKGEFVYLIGKTGSGKSSLLKTLYAELPLTIGEGHIAGFNLTKLKRRQVPYLRRKLGIISRIFSCFPTVLLLTTCCLYCVLPAGKTKLICANVRWRY